MKTYIESNTDEIEDEEFILGQMMQCARDTEKSIADIARLLAKKAGNWECEVTDESNEKQHHRAIEAIEEYQEVSAELAKAVQILTTLRRKMSTQSNRIRHLKGLPRIDV